MKIFRHIWYIKLYEAVYTWGAAPGLLEFTRVALLRGLPASQTPVHLGAASPRSSPYSSPLFLPGPWGQPIVLEMKFHIDRFKNHVWGPLGGRSLTRLIFY